MSFAESRRSFLKKSALFAGMQFLPSGIVGLQGREGANDKVNMAFVGVGGRGLSHISGFRGQNYVAFCDVDHRFPGPNADENARNAATVMRDMPQVARYFRYQRMLEEMADEIDAVVITTPDHTHYEIARACMMLDKHVYVEKPLAQTVAQVRELSAIAAERNLITQMGNQGHSTEDIRRAREIVQAGVLGDVTRVQCWTDRPVEWWPQGFENYPQAQDLPVGVDWDAWLGEHYDAQQYAYVRQAHPFGWRGFLPFGTGALGDMACHIMDAPYWALDLGQPTSVTAEVRGGADSSIAYPVSSRVRYQFPARGEMPALELIWMDGEFRPERPPQLEEGREMGNPSGGSLMEGSVATMMGDSHSDRIRIIPEQLHDELEPSFPQPSLPRVGRRVGHHGDFIAGIKEGYQPSSSITEYAASLTETVLLGALAQRFPGEELNYVADELMIEGNEAATELLRSVTGAV